MNRKSENVNETQAASRQPPAEDFGDVSQYRELNAIGTGKLKISICDIFIYIVPLKL